MNPDRTAFISGHLDLTEAEFREHYAPVLDQLINENWSFVVGDAPGADLMAQAYLAARVPQVRSCEPLPIPAHNARVFHMLSAPRNNPHGFPTVGGIETDRARDEAMTAASVLDVAWVRPGREKSGTAKNLKRRLKQQ